jgi:hypothetical protein
LSFSLVADPNFDNPELATEWFNFSPDFDITQLASLPLPDSLRVTVSLTDLFFECSEVRCQQTASQRTFFDVTSFSRTVASVPEPGALGFTRRRPAQPA